MRQPIDPTMLGGSAGEAACAEATTTAEQVVRFLRHNPDFLLVQPDLLHDLAAPLRWTGDKIVDFQRFMVDMLRGELAGVRDCASAVIETSRSNLSIQAQTHAAVLALVAASGMEELVRVVSEDLPHLLEVDTAILAFEPLPAVDGAVSAICPLAPGDVDALLGAGRDSRLMSILGDDDLLFAGSNQPIRSAALARVRLGGDRIPGLLALGSFDAKFFQPGQGTDLLMFLARIVEVCLPRLLPRES
ncbi:MAG TPA: DUF484 family protein [Rhodospirillales bacterium]|nr:DUF484 family protein [Rhodospirillales bacterium]